MMRTNRESFSFHHFRAKSRRMTTTQRMEKIHLEEGRTTPTTIIWSAVKSKANRLDHHQVHHTAGCNSRKPSTTKRQTQYKISQFNMAKKGTCDLVTKGSFSRKQNLLDDSWTRCSVEAAEWAHQALQMIHLTHKDIFKNRLSKYSSIKEASKRPIRLHRSRIWSKHNHFENSMLNHHRINIQARGQLSRPMSTTRTLKS